MSGFCSNLFFSTVCRQKIAVYFWEIMLIECNLMDWAKILALPYFFHNGLYMIFASNPIHVAALFQLLAKNAMFF